MIAIEKIVVTYSSQEEGHVLPLMRGHMESIRAGQEEEAGGLLQARTSIVVSAGRTQRAG